MNLAGVGVYPRKPIPLLYGTEAEVPFGQTARLEQVFFAGHCHQSKPRQNLGPGTDVPPGRTPAGRYEWQIRRCDVNGWEGIPYTDWVNHLHTSTWVILPPGSNPTSFGLYQALQAGALPVIPYRHFKRGIMR